MANITAADARRLGMPKLANRREREARIAREDTERRTRLADILAAARAAGTLDDEPTETICPDHGWADDACGCDARANLADATRKGF